MQVVLKMKSSIAERYNAVAKICDRLWENLDSIGSRFNVHVLNMPISTTAPIDAKTNV
jgi:hypothetical protein